MKKTKKTQKMKKVKEMKKTEISALHGNLLVVSAPSGAGKTTLVHALTKSLDKITVSISHTTRKKRPAEKDGVNYHFVSTSIFRQMIAEEKFLEHATIFGNLYGTSGEWVKNTLQQGMDVILEIDWQGCQHVKALFPGCISIFIVPPSPHILAERLRMRRQDDHETIEERLRDACETLTHISEYDYIVLNDDFETALSDLQAIVAAGRLSQQYQKNHLSSLLALFEKDVLKKTHP